jgi:malate dehydrogenase
MGVPCVLAEEGIARVIELPLDAQEQAMFDHSADQVMRDIAEMNVAIAWALCSKSALATDK